jgi:hypothetical protein
MPQRKNADPPKQTCPGGLSYNRRRESHKLGQVEDILCFRCGKRMGCSACCDRPKDLICLICHDWASRTGLREHGPMVPRDKRVDAMKIVTMAYEGKVTPNEADLLFQSLWNLV